MSKIPEIRIRIPEWVSLVDIDTSKLGFLRNRNFWQAVERDPKGFNQVVSVTRNVLHKLPQVIIWGAFRGALSVIYEAVRWTEVDALIRFLVVGVEKGKAPIDNTFFCLL